MSRWNDPYGGGMDPYHPNPNYMPQRVSSQQFSQRPPNFLTVEEVESRQRQQSNNNQHHKAHQGANPGVNQSRKWYVQGGAKIDISNSNLQATAQEFQPSVAIGLVAAQKAQFPSSNGSNHASSSSAASSTTIGANTGAVRRNNYQSNRSRNYNNRNDRVDRNDRIDRKNVQQHEQHEQQPKNVPISNNSVDVSDDSNSTINNTNQKQKSTGHNRDRRKAGVGGAPNNAKYPVPIPLNQNQNENQRDDWGNTNNSNNSNRYKGNSYRASNESFGYYGNRENRRDWDSWASKKNQNQNVKIERRPSYDNWRQRDSERSSGGKRENFQRKNEKGDDARVNKTNKEPSERSKQVNNRGDYKEVKNREPITSSVVVSQSGSTSAKARPNTFKKKLDAASQRERLEQMVTHRMLECLVCCEKLRHTDKIWSCKQCFHILHLGCVIKWAKSSKLENGWRCPACQNVLTEVPSEYRCYCDKFLEPKFEPGAGLIPHSCGELCKRKGRNCEHACTLLCHPGPCPDCTAMVQRACACGRTKPTVKCKSNLELTCGSVCDKALNCGVHKCAGKCHWDDCPACTESVKQECHCGKVGRKVPCTEEAQGVDRYACGDTCDRPLTCGNHKCGKVCHSGDCESCPSDPRNVHTCPCGKNDLDIERKSCLDPIPCCDKVCNKKLKCGQPSQPHLCQVTCHNVKCPQCPLTTMVRCRCGHMDREIACKELTTKADDARCQKKCTKKRLCTKHKCNQYCCIEVEHDCPLPCNHTLSCGLHRCELNCHVGRCPPCWRTSFQELYCECGASVIYPPIPCGMRAPECTKPCSRIRPCGHEPMHNCHTGPCPPCTLFTTKMCHGKHESRQTIPCHQEDFSCGLRCNKEMPCGQHRCIQICHKGVCPMPCAQPCISSRVDCEHACNQPCHDPPCPSNPCRQTVTVSCECGLRYSTRICNDLFGDYQKIAMIQLASKMADIQRGQSVDITDMVKQKRGGTHRTLECNDECRLVERNRRMAIGLQLRNPDLSSKLTPRYSDYMKQWAKKDGRFCQNVHDKLTELVQLAKQSKQRSRSHSFECMNREKRHFVHEYCEHFGCESAAYDKEPNRNVVATASKDKSWLPSCSIIEFLQRECGQRKVPGPTTRTAPSVGHQVGESVSLKLQQPRAIVRPKTPPAEFVDYFDNPP